MSKPHPIELDPLFGCHLWRGKLDRRDGRALLWRGRTPVAAYLVIWQERFGVVPDGQVLDHLCRRPWCVALHHLEVVTVDENERRKSWRHRAKRRTCPRGHDLNLNGIVVPPLGGRVCRQCNRDAQGVRA